MKFVEVRSCPKLLRNSSVSMRSMSWKGAWGVMEWNRNNIVIRPSRGVAVPGRKNVMPCRQPHTTVLAVSRSRGRDATPLCLECRLTASSTAGAAGCRWSAVLRLGWGSSWISSLVPVLYMWIHKTQLHISSEFSVSPYIMENKISQWSGKFVFLRFVQLAIASVCRTTICDLSR